MNKRSIKLLSLLLALMMIFPAVLMACGENTPGSTTEVTTGTTATTDTETTATTDTTDNTDTTATETKTTDETTEPTTVETEDPDLYKNTEYDEFTAWEVEAKKLGIASTVLAGLSASYLNDEIKYFISDEYNSDLSTYTETTVNDIGGTSNILAVWEIKIGDTPTDPEEKRLVSVYLSKITYDFTTEYTKYTTQQGKDFLVSFKTNLPFPVYATITKTQSKSFTIAENTPFVAREVNGTTGMNEDRIKIKYIYDEPGEYVVNYFYRTIGSNGHHITSVPLTITENKKYVESPFRVYVLNLDGAMTTMAIDRFEKGFYNKYPMMYYAFTELPNAKAAPNEKTIYLRVITRSTDDPIGHPTTEMIAYVWGRPDTVYFQTATASALDAEDTLAHELTHILQKGWTGVPGFFTEGLAEAARYIYGGNRNSGWNPPNDKTNELESYNAGGFFVYITKTYGEYFANKNRNSQTGITNILVELFRLSKNGEWRNTSGTIKSSWVWLTGKDFDELLAEYRASSFTMPTDYSKPDGNYVNFVKDIRVTIPDGYEFR